MIAIWLTACATDGPFTAADWASLGRLALDEDPALPAASPANEVADDPAAVHLGRGLYSDVRLSDPLDDGVPVSCDTCHDLCLEKECDGPLDGDPSGADPRSGAVSHGAGGSTGRNTPSVLNTALRERWSWIGRYCSLQEQILFPIGSQGAYNADDPKIVATRVASAWREPYEALFGAIGPIDPEEVCDDATVEEDDNCRTAREVEDNVGFAFEAFVRTLVVTDTPFDRQLRGEDALTPAQVRGAKLFVGRGHCVECHSGPLLSDGQFHHVGVPDDDPGRADEAVEVCGERDLDLDLGGFQTPPLRGVANTAPYMHDGSIGSLWEVLEHYNVGGQRDGVLGEVDPRIRPLGLSDSDLDDLEQFLRALGPS